MSDKALVIISSGEVGKALTGLMWATNALRFGWMEDVRVIFFGPAQDLALENDQVKEMAKRDCGRRKADLLQVHIRSRR